jgi:hypothetical protein
MDYKKMNINDIIAWCVANKQVDWLKAESAKTFTTKEGKERNITFIEIKLAFAKQFMPEILPKAKEKKPTMYELIQAL